MSAIQFLKKATHFLMRSNKKEKNKDKIEGCTPQLNNLPSSSHQKEEKYNDDEEEKCNTDNIKSLTKLFVGGLDHSTTSEELEDYFSVFGPVINCIVLRHPKSKRSRGFGFVTFVHPENAKAALGIKDHVLNEKIVDLKPFRSKSNKRNYENRIFLGSLPSDITKEDIRQFFSKFGEVEDVVIPLERETMKSKRFGFLSFKDKSAAERCLAVRFVYINAKRILIRKAEPPSFDNINENLSIDSISDINVEVGLEVTDSFGKEKFRHWDLSDQDTSSVVSGESHSIIEMNPEIQKFCQDYFLTKLSNFNAMNEKETKDGFSDDDVEEMQKLLEDFFINSSDQLGAFGEDLIEFSDKSEDSATDEENDVTDDDTDVSVSKNFESKLKELNEQFTKILENKSSSCTEFSESKSSAPQMSEFFSCQKSSMPFKIKDEKGSLVCSLCQWVPPENSCETFLAHCKTAAHRTKLKKRFLSEQNQEKTSETVIFQNSKRTRETGSDAKAFPEKHSTHTQESHLMKQYENQRNKKSKEKKLQQLKSQQQSQVINQLNEKKTSKKIKKKNIKDKKDTQQNLKKKEEKIKALKITALAKSMACIQPLSKHELICKMCNKIIPKALDMNALMRNVSQHLQSRGHLSKMLEIENSLKKEPEQNDQKPKGGGTKKENSGEKNTKKQKNLGSTLKVEISKQGIPGNAAPLLKEQKISNKKKVSNTKSSAPETVRSNLPKEKPDKKKICSNTVDLTTDYLCSSCNSYFQSNETIQGSHEF